MAPRRRAPIASISELDELILKFFLLVFQLLSHGYVRAHGENPAADITLSTRELMVESHSPKIGKDGYLFGKFLRPVTDHIKVVACIF